MVSGVWGHLTPGARCLLLHPWGPQCHHNPRSAHSVGSSWFRVSSCVGSPCPEAHLPWNLPFEGIKHIRGAEQPSLLCNSELFSHPKGSPLSARLPPFPKPLASFPLCICLWWTVHPHRISQRAALCVWLIALSTVSSRLTGIAAHVPEPRALLWLLLSRGLDAPVCSSFVPPLSGWTLCVDC